MSRTAADRNAERAARWSDQVLALDTLARTLWGEARGEGRAGMQAVANVIRNRAARPGWWGRSVVQPKRLFAARRSVVECVDSFIEGRRYPP